MSFSDQLALIRRTNILVGVHGAGLMFIMFAAEEVRTYMNVCGRVRGRVCLWREEGGRRYLLYFDFESAARSPPVS